jgi:tetratricopeptide (TPR) repeat protein
VADKKKNEDELPVGVNPQAVYVGGESLADRLLPHIKKIFAAIGILGVLITAFFTWRWYSNRQAAKATSALVSALDELDAEIGEAATGTEPDAEPSTSYPTRQARAEAVLGKLRKVKGDPRSGAALLEADLLFQSGQLDAAEAAYRKVAGKKTIEGVVAREGLGYVAEARGELDKALEAFRAAQPDEAGPRREVAMYHEGRILALQGKKEEARAALDKALAKAKELGSDLESIIEVRLTQLDAPPPAPGTKPPAPVEVPAKETP